LKKIQRLLYPSGGFQRSHSQAVHKQSGNLTCTVRESGRSIMKNKVLFFGSLAILSVACVLLGQSTGPAPRPAATPAASSVKALPFGEAQRKMLDLYCVGSQRR